MFDDDPLLQAELFLEAGKGLGVGDDEAVIWSMPTITLSETSVGGGEISDLTRQPISKGMHLPAVATCFSGSW